MPEVPPTFRPPWQQGRRESRRQHDRRRGSAAQRGYDHDWRRLAEQVKAAEPLCRMCRAAGRLSETEVVDHIVPVWVEPSRRLDRSNLQGLCKRCHDGPKQQEELRRYGRRRR